MQGIRWYQQAVEGENPTNLIAPPLYIFMYTHFKHQAVCSPLVPTAVNTTASIHFHLVFCETESRKNTSNVGMFTKFSTPSKQSFTVCLGASLNSTITWPPQLPKFSTAHHHHPQQQPTSIKQSYRSFPQSTLHTLYPAPYSPTPTFNSFSNNSTKQAQLNVS